MEKLNSPAEQLRSKFGEATFTEQRTKDEILTLWLPLDRLREVLSFLKSEIEKPYTFLYDITAIDERSRNRKNGYPVHEFTVVYHLLSFERNNFIRLKIALKGDYPTAPS